MACTLLTVACVGEFGPGSRECSLKLDKLAFETLAPAQLFRQRGLQCVDFQAAQCGRRAVL